MAEWRQTAEMWLRRTDVGNYFLCPFRIRQPGISGIWRSNAGKYKESPADDFKQDDTPVQPWAEALYRKRLSGSWGREEPIRKLPLSRQEPAMML
jgi:hypothetical protein